MTESNRRRYPLIALDQRQIGAMLQPALPSRSISTIELLTGGYINTNYLVRVSEPDEAFVLRLYAHDPACCRKEWNVFRRVSSSIPIPEIVYVDTEGAQTGRPYSVSRWVDGVKLDEVVASGSADDIGKAAHAAGAMLADISAYTFDATGFLSGALAVTQPFEEGFGWFEPHLGQNLLHGRPGERLGREGAERLYRAATARADLLDSIAQRRSLVHADYRQWNLLMKPEAGKWRVAAVLDWEFAFSGWPLVDLGGMLRADDELPPPFESEFARGFEDHGGHLPPPWKTIGKLLDLVNVLDFLDAPDEAPARIEIGRKAALRTIAYLETLGP